MTFNEFTGFTAHDFATFSIPGLEGRMQAIRERIQPKFRALGAELCAYTALLAGQEMCLHIAQHARRKTNAPVDTWLAIGHNKRGYKMYPHFQIGLFDDHLFVWLAYIYELPQKRAIAEKLLANLTKIRSGVPGAYLISDDHMQKNAVSLNELQTDGLRDTLARFRDVKKAEWLIGRHVPAGDPIAVDGETFVRFAKETFETLMPLYLLTREVV